MEKVIHVYVDSFSSTTTVDPSSPNRWLSRVAFSEGFPPGVMLEISLVGFWGVLRTTSTFEQACDFYASTVGTPNSSFTRQSLSLATIGVGKYEHAFSSRSVSRPLFRMWARVPMQTSTSTILYWGLSNDVGDFVNPFSRATALLALRQAS